MDSLASSLTWIGYFFAFIGILATLLKSIRIWRNIKRLDWGDIDKLSKALIKQMHKAEYYPDVVVTIGRGGAIVGAIISGNFHTKTSKDESMYRNVPLLGVDRLYNWQNGSRDEIDNDMTDFSPLSGRKVLLIAADVMTGGTMEFFVNKIHEASPSDVRTACLIKGLASVFNPDFVGKDLPADFSMPWMYRGFGYIRDSRKPIKEAN